MHPNYFEPVGNVSKHLFRSLFPKTFETVKKKTEKYLDPMFFPVHLHQGCDGSSNICTASFQRFSTKHSLKMTSPCIFTFCVSDISGYRSCIYLNRGSILWREISAFDLTFNLTLFFTWCLIKSHIYLNLH